MNPACRALALLLALMCGLWPSLAVASVELELSSSARSVGVGEEFRVELSAMSRDGDEPSDPQLAVPDGFEVRGPSVGTRQQVSINNFNMDRVSGIGATWVLRASRPGLFTIGPASVRASAGVQRAAPLQIQVLEQSPRNQRRPRRSPDPLDPFSSFGRGMDPFDDLFDRLRGRSPGIDRLPDAPPELVVQAPPDPSAFLVARIDKPQAVVGEQVTLSVYAYGGRGNFQEASGAREPSLQDFLAQRMVEDQSRQPMFQFDALGRSWIVVKVRELALFPLRAGELEIGPLKFGFLGRGYRDDDHAVGGSWRSTQALKVSVSEPPVAGRPPGYNGEVGVFSLVAEVEPRTVEAGGAVSVSVKASGEGRLPSALKTPEQAGVEWLEPTLKDQTSVSESRLGGVRRFGYVVRLTRAGEIDLGDVTLPLFNPNTRRYQVAKAALGRITVTPAKTPPPAASAEGPRLSELAGLRLELEPTVTKHRYLSDRSWFWLLLALGPGLVVAAAFAVRGAANLRRALRRREASDTVQAAQALREAKLAHKAGDSAGVASGIERALYRALGAATGLKPRALLRDELAQKLTQSGLEASLAESSVELLERCDQLRFAGGGNRDAAADIAAAGELLKTLARRSPRVSSTFAARTEGS
jgi:hypothetical protein